MIVDMNSTKLPAPRTFLGSKIFPALLCAATGLGISACSSPTNTTHSTQVPSSTHAVSSAADSAIPRLKVHIENTLPFDATAFTQGLEVDGDRLLVSTGWKGESRIFHRSLDGVNTDEHNLDPEFFGEGSTRFNDVVWQLTWQSGVAFKRDAETLVELQRVTYPGEGWGLCSFNDTLVMSDGTNELRFLNGDTFEETSRIAVTRAGLPATSLNELACTTDNGVNYVWANVFLSTDIYKINATTGVVEAIVDASDVPNNATDDPNHVLNGIAAIPGTDKFYITGKRWPDLYEVRFVNAQP